MPYDVSGWVEVLWDHTIGEEKQEWCGVIDLNRFCLSGDFVSNSFFGLAKSPTKYAFFANRGVPKDCSEHVVAEIVKNNEFIAKYGEGDFDHTYAFWSEIQSHRILIDPLELGKSQWKIVFETMELFVRHQIKPDWIRLVVWGNW